MGQGMQGHPGMSFPGRSPGSVPGAGVTATLHCWVVHDIKEPRPIGQLVTILPTKLETSGKRTRQSVLMLTCWVSPSPDSHILACAT